VVAVAAGVVAQAGADGLGHLREVGDQGVHVERGQGGLVLQEVVGVGDVGLVVLRVVDLHRLRVDVGNQGVVGVGQFWKFVGHDLTGLH
jgi:hypothetical protein